ncbi:MAG: hypothetical protein AB7O52_01880 [Planctomycetota bacterium]
MLRSLVRLAFIAACVLTIAPVRAQDSSDDLSATEILTRVGRKYSTCKTLRTRATISTEWNEPGEHTRFTRTFFVIDFVRPGRLRFEHTSFGGGGDASAYIIHCDDEGVRSYWDLDGRTQELEDIESGGGTGITQGASIWTAGLLGLLGVARSPLLRLSEAERLPNEELAGVACYRLRGGQADKEYSLWVERGTFVLLRVVKRFTLPDMTDLVLPAPAGEAVTEALDRLKKRRNRGTTSVTETTDYFTVFDCEVPAEALEFRPPDPGRDTTGLITTVDAEVAGLLLREATLSPELSARLLADYTSQQTPFQDRFEPFVVRWIRARLDDGSLTLGDEARKYLEAAKSYLRRD